MAERGAPGLLSAFGHAGRTHPQGGRTPPRSLLSLMPHNTTSPPATAPTLLWGAQSHALRPCGARQAPCPTLGSAPTPVHWMDTQTDRAEPGSEARPGEAAQLPPHPPLSTAKTHGPHPTQHPWESSRQDMGVQLPGRHGAQQPCRAAPAAHPPAGQAANTLPKTRQLLGGHPGVLTLGPLHSPPSQPRALPCASTAERPPVPRCSSSRVVGRGLTSAWGSRAEGTVLAGQQQQQQQRGRAASGAHGASRPEQPPAAPASSRGLPLLLYLIKCSEGGTCGFSCLSERRNSLGLQIFPLKGLVASRSPTHPALKAPLFPLGRRTGRSGGACPEGAQAAG